MRECFDRQTVLGSADRPLEVRSRCEPEDISSSKPPVTACLCDQDLCNGPLDTPTSSTTRPIQETPRRSPKKTSPNRSLKVKALDPTPGLQCFSCGSLLNTNKARCDTFDRTNTSHTQTCLKGEACLMYTWKKSATETASLRECFPTRVLLGSIQDPLKPQVCKDFCNFFTLQLPLQ